MCQSNLSVQRFLRDRESESVYTSVYVYECVYVCIRVHVYRLQDPRVVQLKIEHHEVCVG